MTGRTAPPASYGCFPNPNPKTTVQVSDGQGKLRLPPIAGQCTKSAASDNVHYGFLARLPCQPTSNPAPTIRLEPSQT